MIEEYKVENSKNRGKRQETDMNSNIQKKNNSFVASLTEALAYLNPFKCRKDRCPIQLQSSLIINILVVL